MKETKSSSRESEVRSLKTVLGIYIIVFALFGYGRAQNVAALVAATIFISFTSFELYKEAIPRLFSPETGSYQDLSLALGIIIFSIASSTWMRRSRRIQKL
ncbi:MAG: cation transporter [ANME-2 cluster archaeon]|nr:cation transporter [ANME-2 cluster archaeon]